MDVISFNFFVWYFVGDLFSCASLGSPFVAAETVVPGMNFPEIDCVGWDDASPQHGFHCREQLSVNMRKTLLAWLNGKRLPDRGNSLAI